jgi:NADPH:quinone reductase-like Zn-dependent oxidoreductase
MTMHAVRFDRYGDENVLDVREVETPVPEPGTVVVRVRATALNPGETAIREGAMRERAPATFPSGQGTDLAGVVDAVAPGETAFAVGDSVLGWTDDRAAQAQWVRVPVHQLIPKPEGMGWDVAGSLFVVSQAALASVRAVAPRGDETVVVSAAAGGVGSFAAQLVAQTGATVVGIAGKNSHEWLRDHQVVPVAYGDGLIDRVRAAAGDGVDAFIDTFGKGYVDLAIDLGVPAARINTIIDFEAASRHAGVTTQGTYSVASAATLAQMAALVASGAIEVRIGRRYPVSQVREAYRELASRHSAGKIVLEF